MGDVSKGEGRTVLFVSHNLGAVKELCKSGILLSNGMLECYGTSSKVIDTYLKNASLRSEITASDFSGPLASKVHFQKIGINQTHINSLELSPSQEITIAIDGTCIDDVELFRTSCSIYKDGIRILTIHDKSLPEKLHKGTFRSTFNIPSKFLRPGEYFVAIGGHDGNYLASGHDWIFGLDLISFIITEEYSTDYDFANTGLINLSLSDN